MLDLLCPVCGGRLVRKEKAWRCENHHCFDVARSGYVNLLPPSASGKRHGDDKRMVAARTAFLSRGYYDHLIGAVAVACAQTAGPDACVLDAGCGEGTYTRAIYDALAAKGGCPQLLGADISAEAVRRAARQVPEGVFCAASTAHLPLAAESLDLIVNIFSPLMAEEFLRGLNARGVTVVMITHDMHLMLEYTRRALVFCDGRLIADRTAAAVLCDPALVEQAALKETSLYTLANRCGIAPAQEFVERFIEQDREVREGGR